MKQVESEPEKSGPGKIVPPRAKNALLPRLRRHLRRSAQGLFGRPMNVVSDPVKN